MTGEHPYLTIEVASAPAAHTILLIGEADLLGAPRIEAALEDACAHAPGLVVIDLSNLTFIDSSCLQALIRGHEQCVAGGHRLRAIPGPANVQRLFEITGIDEILAFTDAADEGGAAVSSSNGTTPRTGA